MGKFLIEGYSRIPVEVDIGSEFRYRNPVIGEGDLLVAISQSGETADTLAAMREAERRGARTIAICNVVEASLARASTMPYVKFVWTHFHKRGERNRHRPDETKIKDVYRESDFPMWVGFLWKPRYSNVKPIPFEDLKSEMRNLHSDVRSFYEGKDEDIVGNVFVYDPLFGRINLIVTLRIGIYHDQLHFDEIHRMLKD